MAATAVSFQPTKIKAGSIGYLWAGLATPAADARVTMAATSAGIMTPDATANPNARMLGLTRAGAMARIVPAFETYVADEYAAPVKTQMSGLEATIEAELLEVFNLDILKILTAGFGTFATGSGFDELRLGIGAQVYTSLALVFPTEADATKFMIIHLYKAFNELGIDALGSARRDMAGLKVRFRALDITSRASTDTLGNIWIQS